MVNYSHHPACIDDEAVRDGLDLYRPRMYLYIDADGSDGHHGLILKLWQELNISSLIMSFAILLEVDYRVKALFSSTKKSSDLLWSDCTRPHGTTYLFIGLLMLLSHCPHYQGITNFDVVATTHARHPHT